jgi:hypothetical protein
VDCFPVVPEEGRIRPWRPLRAGTAGHDERTCHVRYWRADKAKRYAQDNPEKVDQAKDQAPDLLDGQKTDGDQDGEQGGAKQPQ